MRITAWMGGKDGSRGACAILLCLLLRAVGMATMTDAVPDFLSALPRQVDGWTLDGRHDHYTPETLSEYIDGGAELFISFRFHEALALKYVLENQPEITVDIFDMGSSADAFGVFAHSRETIDARVGQGCEYAAGLLTFWKERFYVSILAYPETDKKREVVFALAKAIAGAIPSEGPLPPILSLLPAESLIPESVRYFHHYVWLNSFCFVANKNVLDIAHDTPAALAKYRHTAGPYFLLLVRYPTVDRARAAAACFTAEVLAEDPSGTKQTKDGRWVGCRQKGALLVVVFKAPDREAVDAMEAKIEPEKEGP